MQDTYKAKIGEQEFELSIEDLQKLDAIELKKGQYHLLREGKSYHAQIEKVEGGRKEFEVLVNGNKYRVALSDAYDQLIDKMGLSAVNVQQVKEIKAPMPGLVLSINVKAGQAVEKGDALLILEAMKMENVLKSPSIGTVKAIHTEKGKAVEKGTVLIEFD